MVLVCGRACSVKNLLPDGKRLVRSVNVSVVWCGEASGQLQVMVYRLMHGWAWPEGHGEPQQLVAGVVAGRGLLAVCPDERWCAQSMRHHGRAVGRRVSCQVVVLLSFLLDVLWTVIPFRMNEWPWLACCPLPPLAFASGDGVNPQSAYVSAELPY